MDRIEEIRKELDLFKKLSGAEDYCGGEYNCKLMALGENWDDLIQFAENLLSELEKVEIQRNTLQLRLNGANARVLHREDMIDELETKLGVEMPFKTIKRIAEEVGRKSLKKFESEGKKK